MIAIPNLTQSMERQKILRLYFSDPQKRYYLRQLEKLLGVPVGNIRRELLRLEKTGMFRSEHVGNLVYYYVNTKHPLYREFKTIIFKTIGVEGSLREAIQEVRGVLAAFLFGSFAKGEEDSSSDIDLYLVIQEKAFHEDALIRRISRLEKQFGREINYHYAGLKEFMKKKKEDSFIKTVLKEKKLILLDHECLH